MVNSAIESFCFAQSHELERNLRINAVSFGLLKESAIKYKGLFRGYTPITAIEAGEGYVRSIFGGITGQTIRVRAGSGVADQA